jgi:hypothetical protein
MEACLRFRDAVLIGAALWCAVRPALAGTVPSPTFGTVTVNNGLSLGFTEGAGTVLAAPSGTAGAPAWRALVGADVPTFTSSLTGVVPASGGGTANFLRADGMWAAPAGSGGGVSSFDTRTGAVTLSSGDVTGALGYTPLAPANNLSDVGSASTARANLGLGGLAQLGVGVGLASSGGNASVSYGTTAGTAAQGNDSRLSAFTATTAGIAPASGGGTANYLRADGTWAAPPGGSGGTPGGSSGQVQYNNGGAFGGLTNAALTADIATFTASLSGAAPASGGGTANFLRADGTWAAPAGAGTVTSVTCGAGLSGGTITSSGTCALPSTGTAGSYGAAASVPVFTTDAYGRVISVTPTAITPSGIGALAAGGASVPQVTGRFYSSSGNGFTTQTDQSTASITVLTATPVYLTGGLQVKKMAIDITTGVSSSFTFHVGIFADNGGTPVGSTILVDSGAITVAASSTGAQIATISSGPTLAAGWYWVVLEMPYLATSPSMEAWNIGSPGAMGTAQMGLNLTQGSAPTFCNGVALANGNQTSYGAIASPFPSGAACANYNLPVVWIGF